MKRKLIKLFGLAVVLAGFLLVSSAGRVWATCWQLNDSKIECGSPKPADTCVEPYAFGYPYTEIYNSGGTAYYSYRDYYVDCLGPGYYFHNYGCDTNCSGAGGGGVCDPGDECKVNCPVARQNGTCGTSATGATKYCCAPAAGGGGSCTLTLTPASASVAVNSSTAFSVTTDASYSGGYIAFSSSDTGVATVNPTTDSNSPYQTSATGISAGTATIRADARVTGSSNIYCSDTSTLTVTTGPTPTPTPTPTRTPTHLP